MFFMGLYFSNNLLIKKALVSVFGIGWSLSCILCDQLGIGWDCRVFNLNKIQWLFLAKRLEAGLKVFPLRANSYFAICFFGLVLRKKISLMIDSLIQKKSYRGLYR
jgi:ribosomal protein S13